MKRLAALILTLIALAAPARAQDDEGVVVEELVVTAAQPGPAWWKVSKGESTVFIMGAPMGYLPKDLEWDTSVLDRRLDGAKALILPSGASLGLGDVFGLIRLRGQLKGDGSLESALPEPTRSRFIAARTALDKDAGRYAKWGPVWAGQMLYGDYADAHRFEGAYLAFRPVQRLARRHRVPIERQTYKGMPMLKAVVGEMSDEEKAIVCLDGYVEAVTQDPALYRASAEGWAGGDVRAALDVVRGPDICNAALADNFTRDSIRDQVEAIAAALETPGKAVAVVPLRRLVVEDGVIEQLRARGFQVIDPASLQD